MKERDEPTWHEMRTQVPPTFIPHFPSPLPNDHVLTVRLKSILINANVISGNRRWRLWCANSICISSLPPLHPFILLPRLINLDICNPHFIVHSYHNKRIFSTRVARIPSDSLFLSALRPTDVLRRARLIGERKYLLGTESVPGLSRCSHLSRKPFRRILTSVSITA